MLYQHLESATASAGDTALTRLGSAPKGSNTHQHFPSAGLLALNFFVCTGSPSHTVWLGRGLPL